VAHQTIEQDVAEHPGEASRIGRARVAEQRCLGLGIWAIATIVDHHVTREERT